MYKVYIPVMTFSVYICQGIKEELPALKTVFMHRYKDYIEKRGGRLMAATKNNTDNMMINRTVITRKQNGKENNSKGVLSD